MKKFLALLLALCMVFALAACGEAETEETTPAGEETAPAGETDEELTWGLTPFEETQHIRMGLFTGSVHSYMAYFAEQLGVLDALNIDAEFMWFTGGPAMLEAGNDWDICTLGLGGIATGLSTYDYVFIENTDYEDNMAIFVRPDSEIAKDPENPEVWKGAECVYALGTTAQFVLSAYLNTLGLSLADVESINADNANALTVFSGGTGDVLCCWNAIAFSAEDAGYVRVTDAGTLGVAPICGSFVHPDFLEENHTLVSTMVAVCRLATEWTYENPDEAASIYYDHCMEEGFLCTEDVAKRTVEWYAGPTVDEFIERFTTEGEYNEEAGRNLLLVEEDILQGYNFFLNEGNYTVEQRAAWLKDGKVDNSVALEVKELLGR
ncbi:MAG TPA: ABC transporter substrate-binding protein [Candidatus Scatomorpha merdipullorum]|uniref:ABC transporter substrate-binding protein n=1 Tax=Candidatus Scatomorpha merdipullorum TaxID=2840927 RepID=A0A9D1FDJ6_9FIRM|nr:ABC transporter substrate-binding protein [Candidatus Scatomorpha merdipullorum]